MFRRTLCVLAVALQLAGLLLAQSQGAAPPAYGSYDLSKLFDPERGEMDTALFDEVLDDLIARAGNYPPSFRSEDDAGRARRDAQAMGRAIDVWTSPPGEGGEVELSRLLRGGRLWAVAHNMDVQGADAKALGLYERAVAAAPEDGEVRFHLGAFLSSTNTLRERAIEHLEKAVELGHPLATWGLGIALVKCGREEEAVAQFEAWSKLHPDDPRPAGIIEAIRSGQISKREEPAAGDPVSIVALTTSARALEEGALHAAAVRALGADALVAEDAVEVRGSAALIRLKSFALQVVSIDEPMVSDVDAFADSIDELRLREAVRKHRAGLRIMASPDDVPRAAKICAVSKLLGELADESCLALSFSDSQRLFFFSENVPKRLRAANPIRAMLAPDMPEILRPADEAAMVAAVAKARATLAEFRTYVAAGAESLAIKVEFVEGEHSELMWVSVTELGETSGVGTLANEPVWISKISVGDRVTFDVAKIEDWLCVVDGERKGGFTVDVLSEQEKGPATGGGEETPKPGAPTSGGRR